MLLSVPCAWGCLALMRRQGGRLEGEMAEAMMDGQFYLVGLAALGWGLLTAAGHVPAK